MTDLEYAEQIARELIPLPEMAGSEQLRRSIAKVILNARADEAHKIGMEYVGGWGAAMCFKRARILRALSASNPTAPTDAALPQAESASAALNQSLKDQSPKDAS